MTDNETTSEGGTVVVGVDGSTGATAALRFALRDAARRGAALRVVAAYAPPDYTQVWIAPSRGAGPTENDEFTAEVRAGADQMVADARAALVGEPQPANVEVVVAAGSPARALIDLSGDAALLVVGSRGRGGFASLAMGSVSLQCVLHASCPVTVVPRGRPRRVEDEIAVTGSRFEPVGVPPS